MFMNSGLIHVGSNVAEFDMIGDALLVFKVKDDTDFQEKIGHLDKVLQAFEDSAMHAPGKGGHHLGLFGPTTHLLRHPENSGSVTHLTHGVRRL